MGSGLAGQWILPLVLFTIMLGVGMSLRLEQFRLLLSQPAAVIVGVFAQLLLLPILGIIIIQLFNLPPEAAIGLMIITFAPGGATSNMITYLSRGDTALSVSLTGISGLITPFTLPLFTLLVIEWQLAQQSVLQLPVIQTMLKLLFISVLPVLLGMWINHRWHSFCVRSQRGVKTLSALFLIVAVVGIVKVNWAILPALLTYLGPAVIVMVSVAMLLGYSLARWMKLTTEQGVTYAVEIGIQNAAVAMLVTGTILMNDQMTASAMIYGVLMNLPIFALIIYRNLAAYRMVTE